MLSMESIKKRYLLSSSEARNLLSKAYSMGFISKPKYSKVEILEFANGKKILLLDTLPLLILEDELLLPTLFNAKIKDLPFLKVDDGAIPHILNGADVMAPGVIEYTIGIKEDMIVAVKDIKDNFLAIGKVLDNLLDKLKNRRGKVVLNLHYKYDRYYKIALGIIKSRR